MNALQFLHQSIDVDEQRYNFIPLKGYLHYGRRINDEIIEITITPIDILDIQADEKFSIKFSICDRDYFLKFQKCFPTYIPEGFFERKVDVWKRSASIFNLVDMD